MQNDDPWQHWFKQRRSANCREWREWREPRWRTDLAIWLDAVAIVLSIIVICMVWL